MSTTDPAREEREAQRFTAQAQLDHFRERLEQYRLDWERAILRSHRSEYRDEVQSKLDEAYLQRAFFEGVIAYYERKVQWFDNAIFPAIHWENDADVAFVEDFVYPEQNRIWELLDSIRYQLHNVNEQIQNQEFDQFLFNFNMAEIDSAWFEGDIARQKKWIDDTYNHMARLDGLMNDLLVTDPDDETIVYLPVEN
jgi:hypothetical protein